MTDMPTQVTCSRIFTVNVKQVIDDYFYDEETPPSWDRIKDVIIEMAVEELTKYGHYSVPVSLHDQNGFLIERLDNA